MRKISPARQSLRDSRDHITSSRAARRARKRVFALGLYCCLACPGAGFGLIPSLCRTADGRDFALIVIEADGQLREKGMLEQCLSFRGRTFFFGEPVFTRDLFAGVDVFRVWVFSVFALITDMKCIDHWSEFLNSLPRGSAVPY